MLSRVANSIYWMNRYIERAENVARFIEVNSHLMLDLPPSDGGAATDEQWAPLVQTAGDLQPFKDRYGDPTRGNVTWFLTFDPENPNSILSCLRAARHNARQVREIISSEMWEQVNVFSLTVEAAAGTQKPLEETHDFYTRMKMASHLFKGITDATMSQNEAWHFGRMGRLIERADKTSRILDVKYYILLPQLEDVGTPYDNIQWAALLKSASALEMYRKRHGLISPGRVAEFLTLDREFSRAMLFSLNRAQDSMRHITGSGEATFCNKAEQYLGRLVAELSYAEITDIIHEGLHEFLDRFQTRLNHVDDCILETFFALRPVGRDDHPVLAE